MSRSEVPLTKGGREWFVFWGSRFLPSRPRVNSNAAPGSNPGLERCQNCCCLLLLYFSRTLDIFAPAAPPVRHGMGRNWRRGQEIATQTRKRLTNEGRKEGKKNSRRHLSSPRGTTGEKRKRWGWMSRKWRGKRQKKVTDRGHDTLGIVFAAEDGEIVVMLRRKRSRRDKTTFPLSSSSFSSNPSILLPKRQQQVAGADLGHHHRRPTDRPEEERWRPESPPTDEAF